MDLGVFYEVVVPLMEMKDTASIFISTPVDTFNFYSEMAELRDEHNELLFNVITVKLVCKRCKGTEAEDACNHPTGDKPPWKLETTEKMVAIYGDRKTLLNREVKGKVTDAEDLAFEVRDMRALFASAPIADPHPLVDRIYVAVDPNGGAAEETGLGSQTALISFFYTGHNIVVCLRARALREVAAPRRCRRAGRALGRGARASVAAPRARRRRRRRREK